MVPNHTLTTSWGLWSFAIFDVFFVGEVRGCWNNSSSPVSLGRVSGSHRRVLSQSSALHVSIFQQEHCSNRDASVIPIPVVCEGCKDHPC